MASSTISKSGHLRMDSPSASRRGSIVVENAKVLAHESHPGSQYILKLEAPSIAERALPGCFVHLRCDPELPMRRPMSVMRADATRGVVEILYKIHGHGTRLLATRTPGEQLNVMGPIGTGFKLRAFKRRPLLIGGGVGIPPMVYLAEHLKTTTEDVAPLVLMGSELPFPFRARPSQIMVSGIPADVIATMPLLEDWAIPCRLASRQGFAACYEGVVTELARIWIGSLNAQARAEVEIFSCGPTPMLRAVAALAGEFGLQCEISVEEYMACAVGGCAGCAVEVSTESGPVMKRVCVDGPVFDAARVRFPN